MLPFKNFPGNWIPLQNWIVLGQNLPWVGDPWIKSWDPENFLVIFLFPNLSSFQVLSSDILFYPDLYICLAQLYQFDICNLKLPKMWCYLVLCSRLRFPGARYCIEGQVNKNEIELKTQSYSEHHTRFLLVGKFRLGITLCYLVMFRQIFRLYSFKGHITSIKF